MGIHTKRTQLKPWYFKKLNPKMYIPTMLAKGNIAVPESVAIIEYMDKELSSGNLMHNQTEEIKQKYEQFKEIHEAFDVEGYSFGHFMTVWYLRQFMMFSFDLDSL